MSRRLHRFGVVLGAVMAALGPVLAPSPGGGAVHVGPRSPYATVAPGATRLVVLTDRGPNVTRGRVTTNATANAATIERVRAKVNALPAANVGVLHCLVDLGETMTLRFYRTGRATPYAVVVDDPGGCGSVAVHQYDASDQLLGSAEDSGGPALAAVTAHALGVTHWRLSR